MSLVNRFMTILSLACLIMLVFGPSLQAVPPVPGTYDSETMRFYKSGAEVPMIEDHPGPLNAPYRGQFKFPVLFILANDQTSTFTPADREETLFTLGTYPTGSMRDYYREVSFDQFDITGETMGWFIAEHEYAYYAKDYGTGPDRRAAELVGEAVDLAEAAGMNWAQFDNDGDGYVDGVLVIHAGIGGESAGPGSIWSHVSAMEEREYDGVKIRQYSIQPELDSESPPTIASIGTICHEHGHILGLPDLYDVAYTGKIAPVGQYCIMASGSSNNSGHTPAHFCAWCKTELGWANPISLDTSGSQTSKAVQLNENNSVYTININSDPKEYFLIANRWTNHSLQFDHLPIHPHPIEGGLMIYHVNNYIGGSNNGNSDFWRVCIEDANIDTRHLGDAGYGTDNGNTTFGRFTDPSSDGYYLPSNIRISNVSGYGPNMTFDVDFYPTLILESYWIKDLGNQQYELYVELKNVAYGDASNVTGEISTGAGSVTFDNSTSSFGNISKDGGIGDNTSDPFVFSTTGTDGVLARFTVTPSSGSGYAGHDLTFTVPVNPSRILLVDDDQNVRGTPQDFEVFFQEPLDELSYDYETWEVYQHGYPPATIMSLYDLVVWEDGKATASVPKEGGALDEIQAYLDMGGDLFWSSHEFIYSQYSYADDESMENHEPPAGSFVRDYLHIVEFEQDEYYYDMSGVSGSIFDGMEFTMEDVFSDDLTQHDSWWPDEFVTDGQAIPVLTAGPHACEEISDPDYYGFCTEDAAPGENMLEGSACGLLYQGEYRLFFMSAPIHGIPMTGEYNRADFMQTVFDWFGITEMDPSIDIDLNQSMFEAGDPLQLTLRLDNPGPQVTADVFVALDVMSLEYFFWPTWTKDINFETRTLTSGYDNVELLLEFDWPANAGNGGDCRFWAVILNHQNGQVLGNIDFCPIGWL